MAEVQSLKSRVDTILQEVGISAEAAAAFHEDKTYVLDTAQLMARYKELLHTKKYEENALKEDVATLEATCAELKSSILMLENQVQGGPSLLAKGSDSPTSLASRVEAVEKDVADFRTRVTSLEQVVAGLQTETKEAKASLLQSGSKTKLGPLSARLTALEKEVDSLTQRTDTMESEIQGGPAGGALLSEEELPGLVAKKTTRRHDTGFALLEQEAKRSKSSREGTIKERTASLETNVAALKSKMSMLENQAVGRTSTGTAASLLQVQGSGTSLKARISGLEDEVDSLRTRVTTLEHVVEG
jgi:chromosome segregation ATPase